MRAPGRSPRQQQVGNIGTSDQQDHGADNDQDAQAGRVVLAHLSHAGASRDHFDVLLGQHLLDLRKILLELFADKIRYQPIPQDFREAGTEAGGTRPGAKTANHAKPAIVLFQQGICPHEQRFLLDGHKKLRWVAAQGFAVETGRSDADNGERMSIEHQDGAHHLGVCAVFLLPRVVA